MFENLHLTDLTRLRASLNGSPADPSYIAAIGLIVSQWLDEEIRKRSARKKVPASTAATQAAAQAAAHPNWAAAFAKKPAVAPPDVGLGRAPPAPFRPHP